ncbi:glycine betaine ABC transport system integral membrane protein [Streptomyces viridochromogenes DSM 40736]|uniref:Glycine betaine ABC transport system integral membrane protein n=1 Tax=Streptomyces viridochromogenes (strain DSM 40736 / JCM 4977 / BCRC 1201 / Tue 494) TaxID=591159 RepID=D9XB43_STRVT|nr:glycine betaine ABC transport system integral membrane protein [Streptomyces viridochromogenes DSM 40736]
MMATITASPPRLGLPGLLKNRAVQKLLLLALAAAVLVPLANARWASGTWPSALTLDFSAPLAKASDWIIDNRDSHPLFLYFFGHVSNVVVIAVRAVYLTLLAIGWAGVTALGALVAWRVAGVKLALGTAVAFLACGLLGMWVPTMQTLALMVVAVLASVVVGVLLGLAAGLSDRMDRALRPILDTMQVLPAFAYLLPVVLVFGIGVPAAVLATVIYAAPPMARLTSLGLRGADKSVLEAVESLGSTARQRLLTARIPLARKELLLGVNQTIMMALSMAVIAAVIGAGGLGDRVYQALASVDVGAALAAGIPIVLLAVVLDRVTGAAGERLGAEPEPHSGRGWLYALAERRRRGRRRTPHGPPRLARDLDRRHRRTRQPGRRLDDRAPVLGRPLHRRHRRLGGPLHHLGARPDARRPAVAALVVGAADRRRPGLGHRHLAHRAHRRPRHGRDRRARRLEAVPGHAVAGPRGRRRHPRRRLRRRYRRGPQRPPGAAAAPGPGRVPDDAAVRVPDPGRRPVRRRTRPGRRGRDRLRPPGGRPHHHPGPAPGRPVRAGGLRLPRRHQLAAAAAGPAPAGPAGPAARRQPGPRAGPRRRRHRRPGRRWRARLRRGLRPRPGRPGDRSGGRRRDRLPRPDARPGDPAHRTPREEGSVTCESVRSARRP